MSDCSNTEAAYAIGAMVSRLLMGMSGSSGELLKQIAAETSSQTKIAFLRGLQSWCHGAESAIEDLIRVIESQESTNV